MYQLTAADRERSMLRIGGAAGLISAGLMIFVFGIVGVFVGADVNPGSLIGRFPEIRPARIVENGLYLGVVVLWAIQLSALRRTLDERAPAATLVASGLTTLGVAALVVGALPHIATTPISDFYHAQGTTVEQQAMLVMLWQAIQSLFDAMLVTGLLALTLGLISTGVAMRSSPEFGGWRSGMTVGLGSVGFAASLVGLVEISGVTAIAVFAMMVFSLVIGWRALQLSRASSRMPSLATAPSAG